MLRKDNQMLVIQLIKTAKDIESNNTKTGQPPNPLLGQKAEEYLREQANIEDMPNEKKIRKIMTK
jgi:hypothetical protein